MPLTVRIPDDLRDRIDSQRGDVPRERWIRRVLEQALSDSPTGGDASGYARSGTGKPAKWPPIVADTRGGVHAQNCKCPVCKPAKAKR